MVLLKVDFSVALHRQEIHFALSESFCSSCIQIRPKARVRCYHRSPRWLQSISAFPSRRRSHPEADLLCSDVWIFSADSLACCSSAASCLGGDARKAFFRVRKIRCQTHIRHPWSVFMRDKVNDSGSKQHVDSTGGQSQFGERAERDKRFK